jgi:hypothetical protein
MRSSLVVAPRRRLSARQCPNALAMALCVWTLLPGAVLAQSSANEATAPASALRVAVLRATQGEAGELANAVDGALLRDLGVLAGIENPTVSPIDYAEIQLTVGCSDEGRECLAAIAQMVQVDAVVVRHLVVEAGKSTLTLVHYDATASDEPAHAEQIAEGPDASQALVAAVPTLVRRLFGIPEPVVAAPAPEVAPGPTPASTSATAQPKDSGARIAPWTWAALGVGAAVLATGIVFGLSAESSYDAFKHTKIDSLDATKHADSKLSDANSKGTLATVLIPSGAAVLALGATLLVLDLNAGERAPQVSLAPLPGGAFVSVRARAGGL